MKELVVAMLLPALVFYAGLCLWAAVALADWSPDAEIMAYEDATQCVINAAPGEYETECEYMLEDHKNMANQNPYGVRISEREWKLYWRGVARGAQGGRQD